MKVVILAGGFGTRISEESHLKPKPMIEIGDKPILWHIMKQYSAYGFNDFIICCGYKQYAIKQYFSDYYLYNCNVTFDFSDENKMIVHSNQSEPWKVTLVDTGLNTMTGGRIKRIREYLKDETFMLTYGDGVSNINISHLLNFHRQHGKIGTMSAVQPEGRFGVLDLMGDKINNFREKCKDDSGWVNCGFMVMESDIFNYIEDDDTVFEKKPLESIAKQDELMCYKHEGFWQCMDTMRDKEKLEKMWKNNLAPWKVW